jgi:hypothetical protein
MTRASMTKTERRYARLVNLYPSRYPRDEILDTVLLGNAGFSFREASALLAGALRARTGADVRRTPAAFAFSAARLAALTLLVYAAALDILSALPLDVPAIVRPPHDVAQFAVAGLAALMLHVTALIMLARGAYRRAAVAAFLGFPIAVVAQSRFVGSWHFDGFWAAPIALLLILALLFAPNRVRTAPLAWLLAVPPAVILLPTGASAVLGPAWFIQQQAIMVLVALALAWSLLDARVPLAVAALALCNVLTNVTAAATAGFLGEETIATGIATTALPMVALVAAATVSRRRSLT